MMLTPCWPSAGPTGGAGLAWPPTAWSLIWVRTFLAIAELSLFQLDLLDLVEAHFNRRLTTEDGHQDLELLGVLVDLGDLAAEVRQRAGHDLDGLADGELGAAAGALGRPLHVQQTIHLGLGQRHRL